MQIVSLAWNVRSRFLGKNKEKKKKYLKISSSENFTQSAKC